jgi:apolipoprotein N-acyltransferase
VTSTSGGPSGNGPRRLLLLLRGVLPGLLTSLAFPSLDLWWVALVGMVPLLLTLEAQVDVLRAREPGQRGHGFLIGFGYGMGLYVPLLWWIALLDAPALTIPWVRYPAPFLIATYESLFTGLFAWAYVFTRSRLRAPMWLVAGSFWLVAEWGRGATDLGFPWGVLGYSQVPYLPSLQLASVVGISGVTFWLVAINAVLADAVYTGRRRVLKTVVAILLVGVSLGFGTWRLLQPVDGPAIRVALVQPNVSNREKWEESNRTNIFDNLAELTRQGVAEGADLVAWPETAAPCYLLKDTVWRPYVEELAVELRTPIFLGLPDYQIKFLDGGRRVTYTNTGALFDANGNLAGRMDKIQLVPFGERVPFSGAIPFIDRIDFGEADFVPGKEPVIFEVGDHRFGNLVCFEAIFPWLPRAYENRGAEFLVNITNDSWFGAGAGAVAHKNMAVARCVENGLAMARAANSGISVGIDAMGRETGATGLFERTLSVVDVPIHRGRTLYARFGNVVGGASGLLAVGLLLAAVVASRRRMR